MEDKIRNVIIIGSGPAALTAALYNARANLAPLVLAGVKWGGQLMLTTDVENYPGFPEGILGPDLMGKFRDQATRFGAEIIDEDVVGVDFSKRPFLVKTSGNEYKSKSVIIATGAETNWLGLGNEQRLIGRGVSSCAPCDAFFFKDKKVVVVGGGDSAMEEALTLTKFATAVTIVHRRDEFRASKIMIDRAKANKKIKWTINSVVVDVLGKDKVEGVKIKNTKDGSIQDLAVDGMFVAIGHHPMTDIFKGQIELDEKGFVIRKPRAHSENTSEVGSPRRFTLKGSDSSEVREVGGEGLPGSFHMMTSVEGVFAAGDVHDYHYRQVATAAGYGCAAAMEAERWLESQGD